MLKAGFSRVDMTPPLGSPMAGYFEYREAEGILDPLELNAIAVSDGENTILVVTADILYANEVFATNVRNCIEKRTGVPADHVFLQGLHQHTSVALGATVQSKSIANSFYDAPYQDVLIRKYEDVCVMAIADMVDATVGVAQQETAELISFIRRYRMKDGSVRTNPGFLNPNILEPIGEADNTVRLVRFHREGAKDIALVNFSTHPDTVGGCRISADWPGKARRFSEKKLAGAKCMVVNGAEGDTNHVDVSDPGQTVGYQMSTIMGNGITDVVVELWDQVKEVETGKIWGKVEMKYIPTNTKGLEETEQYQALRAQIARGEVEKPKDIATLGEIYRIAELQKELLFQKVPVSVLCIGKVGFVGFGGEPFMEYAAAARKAGKEIYVITACLANGGQGYLPSKEAFDEGGYEAQTSRFTPTVAEVLQGCAADLLEEYRNL